MPKIKKKGTSGQAKNFITRTQAVRKLQISLPDFRRLCIFKGIYPREPRNKKKASKSSTQSTTFYYTKDIQYLLHEPLLNKFRDHKALAKKIAKALGRNEVTDAARLEKTQAPRITLDHIIKERYPTFVDALRDLDDALSMLFLFANLPSQPTVPPKTIALCRRLCLEFQHYLIVSHSLRKSFLSIKGIYYQATIQGQDILWLVPYKFVQRVTNDIDFRIMGTFIEFYTTLLGFVNFRLYTSVGLIYPPKFSAATEEQGAELGAFTLEGREISSLPQQIEASRPEQSAVEVAEATTRAQKLADSLKAGEVEGDADAVEGVAEDGDNTAIDSFQPTAADSDLLIQPSLDASSASALFAPFTFFLSRETPRQPLEFLLKAFGCRRVGWDAMLGPGSWTGNELDSNITHQIVDRPPYQPPPPEDEVDVDATSEQLQTSARGGRVLGRIYVQPQWVWDCVNAGKLLRPDLYTQGATLPPHLSPWVKATRGAYDPTAPLDADVPTMGDLDAVKEKDSDAVEGVDSVKAIADLNGTASDEDMDEDMEDGDMMVDEGDEDQEEEDEDEGDEDTKATTPVNAPKIVLNDDFADFSDNDNAGNDEAAHHASLLAEARGIAPSSTTTTTSKPKLTAAQREKKRKDEDLERASVMLSRKKRKLLGRMMHGNQQREAEADKLRGKRRKLEAQAAAAAKAL